MFWNVLKLLHAQAWQYVLCVLARPCACTYFMQIKLVAHLKVIGDTSARSRTDARARARTNWKRYTHASAGRDTSRRPWRAAEQLFPRSPRRVRAYRQKTRGHTRHSISACLSIFRTSRLPVHRGGFSHEIFSPRVRCLRMCRESLSTTYI